MIMVREWKKEKVAELKRKFGEAQCVILMEFRGLSVSDALKLRRRLWPLDAEPRVVKNSILYFASEGTQFEKLQSFFRGPTAALLCYRDPVGPLKSLYQFMADVPAVKVKAGVLDGRLVTTQDLERLAKLPPLNVLRQTVVGTLASPLRGAVWALSGPLRSCVVVLSRIGERQKSASAS